MGNCFFNADALADAVRKDAAGETSRHDMGGDVISVLVSQGGAHAYDFGANQAPGPLSLGIPVQQRFQQPGRLGPGPLHASQTLSGPGGDSPGIRVALLASCSARSSAVFRIRPAGSNLGS
jgi:hypothetical protein